MYKTKSNQISYKMGTTQFLHYITVGQLTFRKDFRYVENHFDFRKEISEAKAVLNNRLDEYKLSILITLLKCAHLCYIINRNFSNEIYILINFDIGKLTKVGKPMNYVGLILTLLGALFQYKLYYQPDMFSHYLVKSVLIKQNISVFKPFHIFKKQHIPDYLRKVSLVILNSGQLFTYGNSKYCIFI